ncbi:PGF-CTERM protein [Halorubrum aquaticum]|uniref:PGF-CTERM protein n=1 Tax=Halorubrum aquaticum TaxID=387340 RepID=A0A1I3ARN9_9EURY|nr:BGTF surface domain-containing protein [Halorubrum aquaticum]SFH52672.1 PGF-CTERM protein [Halorubrum aquaticum]
MPTQPSTADEAESSGRIVRKLLPAAATVLVAALAVVGVALVGSAFAGTAAADGTASLDASIVSVSEDGTAAIGVETDGVDEFSIAIGDESDTGYALHATVTPDDDGTTSLVLDHAETGGGGTPLTAEGDASVSIDDETGLEEPIAPGSYDVEVSTDGDEPDDVGTLMVEPASTGDGSGDGDEGESADDDSTDGSSDPAVVTESDVEAADVVVEPAETDVSVPVDLADGETVTLRIRSTGDATPAYIKTAEPTVEDGEATATFDLSRASHGDRATLTVRGNDGLDGENEHEVLIVDESIGVEESGEDGGNGGTGSADDGSGDGGSDDGTDTSVPGFGVVVAVLALCATALVANRRRA